MGDSDGRNATDFHCPVSGSGPSRWRNGLLACLLLGLVSAAAAVKPAPGDEAIDIGGESGKQSETRTIRFALEGGKADDICLVPEDLFRELPKPSRIDRAQVRVTRASAAASGVASYEIFVASLPERYGSYSGYIQVLTKGVAAARIPLKLLVRVPSTLPFAANPPSLTLSLKAGQLGGADVLTNWPTAASAPVVVASLPAGVGIDDVRRSLLMSVRGNGEFKGDYRVERMDRGLLLHIDASHASADKYTGTAEIDLAGGDRRITVPLEVSVRVSPWCVLVLLLAGVVVGRAAKWMNEQGQKLIAAQAKVDAFEVRVAVLDEDYRRHLDETLQALRRLVAQNRLAEFDAELAEATARAALIERAASLRRLARSLGNAAARDELDRIASAAAHVKVASSLTGQLDSVEAALTKPAVTEAQAMDEFATARGEAAQLEQTRTRRVRCARWLHTALELAGVVLLAFVGYELLYVNGSATFGANFSDYFGALLWGLGADVMGRTITSLGRVAARQA